MNGEPFRGRAASGPASHRLADYSGLLRRRLRLAVAGALLGLLAGGVVFFLRPTVYTATASVLVHPTAATDPTPLAHGRAPAGINLDTEAQLATTVQVARRATRFLGKPRRTTAPRELLGNVSIAVPPNSAVLRISYDARSPRGARRGADAFARAYLAHRRHQAKGAAREQVTTLRAGVRKLERALEQAPRARSKDSPVGASGGSSAPSPGRGRLTERIAGLQSRITALTTGNLTPGRVLSEARSPTHSTSPDPALYLVTGLMSGLLVGMVAVVVRDRTDRWIRRAGDVERRTGVPVLLDASAGQRDDRGLLETWHTPLGRSFHELGRNVRVTLGHDSHVVLVAGAGSGPGNGVVAANLAAALARAGAASVLVCADPHSRSCDLLRTAPAPGLADLLAGRSPVSDVEQRPAGLPRLRVIAPGWERQDTPEERQGDAMRELIERLRGSASYVIVETRPASEQADAQILADVADAAVVVAATTRTTRAELGEGVSRLDRAGVAVLGTVVLRPAAAPASVNATALSADSS